MPMIDLTLPQGALDEEAREALMVDLTAALLQHEGAPENERTRAMTWGFVHEVPSVYVGGRPSDLPVYRVVITVPEGTLLHGPGPFSAQTRRNLVGDVTDRVLAAEGRERSSADRARVYCLIRAVDDGHWGALGTIVRMEDIVAIATGEHETELARDARAAIDDLLAEMAGT
jgi:phenylpyruvate tautomerase PptA (4-oxalocrotonate tautomerase family)